MTGRGGLRAAAFLAACLSLAGCTTLAPLPPAPGTDALSGRLALRVDPFGAEPARAISAAFDLRGNASDGVLGLSTPLGSTLGQARWSPGRVTLTTTQGRSDFPDLESMTRQVLGESVPIEAWFDWLRGRPWPGAPSRMRPADAVAGGTFSAAAGFEQLGWSVDLGGFAGGSIIAQRDAPPPKVTVRIRVDEAGGG